MKLNTVRNAVFLLMIVGAVLFLRSGATHADGVCQYCPTPWGECTDVSGDQQGWNFCVDQPNCIIGGASCHAA